MSPMCAAQEDIDQIHETEIEARKKIEDAEKQARQIRENADKEAKALMAKAEHNAKQKASEMLSNVEDRKSTIESDIFKETGEKIKKIQKDASKKKEEAFEVVYKMLMGES